VDIPTPTGSVTIHIPPHSQSGTRLRLKGKKIARGNAKGDLYVDLEIHLPDKEDSAFAEAARHANAAYSHPLRDDLKL